MRSLFFTLSLSAVFCCCTPLALAVMTRQDMIELREQSLENLRKGNSARAYDGYLRLLREEPGDLDLDFMVGQAAFAQGNYPMAVLAYLRVLKADPRHERARLELASTYGRMGQAELALAELSTLRAINPALPQLDKMEKSILGAPASPWSFRGTLGAGAFYDSNVDQNTSASSYMGDPLPKSTRTKKKESFGTYVTSGLDLAYRLGQETNWLLVGDVAVTNRQYFNPNVLSMRQTWGRGGIGLRWASEKALAELRGKGEFLGYDKGYVTQNVGMEGTFAYALTGDWTLITQSAYEYRDYDDYYAETAMRGTYGKVGQYVRWQFGAGRHEVLLGGNYFFENAQAKRFDGRGVELLGRVQFNLPWQIKTGLLFAWRGVQYDAPPTIDYGGGKRREDQYRIGVELEKGITEHLSVNTQVQYTDNQSNHSICRYDQWLLTLGLTYAF